MTSRSLSSLPVCPPAIEPKMRNVAPFFAFACVTFVGTFAPPSANAADAPEWMHAVVSTPLPPHDEKTDAVLLYSEDVTSVQPDGKIKSLARRAYKILRPGGRNYGIVLAYFDSNVKITGMRAWCIPQQGKDYEVREKDAIEVALAGVQYSELITDQRDKFLKIPAADPGNVVGYEVQSEEHPYLLQDSWEFQHSIPALQATYTLQLPPGWEFKAMWLNHPEVQPTPSGGNQWQWVVKDVPGIRPEQDMPPFGGLAGRLVVTLLPPSGGQNPPALTWDDIGKWQASLASDRLQASPEIKQEVATLTTSAATPVAKMQALATFVQQQIRYVAIELGIGGWQPHPATDIFVHRYGDCKDKATLMSTMLKEIGIDSYYIVINTDRGGVNPQTPPTPFLFDHVILAIRIPQGLDDSSFQAVIQDPKLGRLLIFDPTDDLTPFGHLRGELQDNYGLLVAPDGGVLIELPQLPLNTSGISRIAKVSLDASGNLRGDVHEIRRGDSAMYQRYALRSATKNSDRVKPIEDLLSASLSDFRLTRATVSNLSDTSLPFIYDYSIDVPGYAKSAGNLLLVRPRLIGTKSSDLLETKDPRKFPVEFDSVEGDVDTFEFTLPPGYVVDDLPSPTDVDYSFGSYHSKAEVSGNVLRYTRSFEIKQLTVPVDKLDELKKFYRIIAGDERSTAVLKPAGN